MNTRRWLSVAAVTVASATLALVGVGSDALASNAAATGTIKACYKTGRQGPPGPAGVSQGISTSSSTSVPLNQGNTLVQVMTITPVPTSGTYYLNASIMLTVGAGDGVACVWSENGTEVGTFATVGDVPNLSYQTVPLSGSLYLPAGTNLQVLCSDYNSVAQTSFYNGAITGVLINSPAGNAKPAATPVRHGVPPKL